VLDCERLLKNRDLRANGHINEETT
jgi:hypothetical protein